MKKLIIALYFLSFFCSQNSHAIRIYVDNDHEGYYRFKETETAKVPSSVKFPIVFYMFSIMDGFEFAKKMEGTEKLYPDGIPLPLYVGYVVIDENYHYTFVDKTRGIAGHLSDIAEELNKNKYKRSPLVEHPDYVSRGKFSDFWHYKDRFLFYTLVDRYIRTMGIPPDDTFSLDKKDTIIGPLHGPVEGNPFDIFYKIKRDNPPGRSASKESELAQ